MKRIALASIAAVLLLITLQSAGWAQTITLDSISATTFCAGDPLSVTFTVTGTWGHKNAFTLQLSNDSGTFDNGFENIGSIQDTAPGTFTIYSTAPVGLPYRQTNIIRNITRDDSIYRTDSTIVTIDTTTVVTIDSSTKDTIRKVKIDTVTTVVSDSLHFDDSYDTTYDTISPNPSHYRLRIIGANPYEVSEDNGSNIAITPSPGKLQFIYNNPYGGQGQPDTTPSSVVTIGVVDQMIPISLQDYGNWEGDTLYWDFGSSATPSTKTTIPSSNNVFYTTYSTAGKKKIIVKGVAPGGCTVMDTTYAYIFDCTAPAIPHDAIVISHDTELATWDDTIVYYIEYNSDHTKLDTVPVFQPDPAKTRGRAFWLNPGVTVTGSQNPFDTIFAEAGSTITDGEWNIIYAKPGSAINCIAGVVVYASGVSINSQSIKDFEEVGLECDSVSFDYTEAPPNSIMHINEGVTPASPMQPIAVSPNPTEGIVTLRGIPTRAEITVMNVLGETVQNITSESSITTLDFSKLARGTYYIRIASNDGVVTKKVVKE